MCMQHWHVALPANHRLSEGSALGAPITGKVARRFCVFLRLSQLRLSKGQHSEAYGSTALTMSYLAVRALAGDVARLAALVAGATAAAAAATAVATAALAAVAAAAAAPASAAAAAAEPTVAAALRSIDITPFNGEESGRFKREQHSNENANVAARAGIK